MNLKASKLNRWALTEGVEWQLTVASFGHLSVIKRNKGILNWRESFQLSLHLTEHNMRTQF